MAHVVAIGVDMTNAHGQATTRSVSAKYNQCLTSFALAITGITATNIARSNTAA